MQALPKGPFHTSKLYEYVGDLREYGHQVRLNLYCQMEKTGNHKLELIEVGEMSHTAILREVCGIFDIDPLKLDVMRVDFAVDIPEVPLQWFRETVRVEHKRFRAAVTGERFYSELGTGPIQTLYFGRRPNLIRIYDKRAEQRHQYRTALRSMLRDGCEGLQPITFESMFGSPADSTLTRVERQIGGRIPLAVATLGEVIEPGFGYKPFSRLRIMDHSAIPMHDAGTTFETYCTGMYLRQMAENDGMQALNSFLSSHTKGNASWARKKFARFLPSAGSTSGLSESDLQVRFQASLARQLSGRAID